MPTAPTIITPAPGKCVFFSLFRDGKCIHTFYLSDGEEFRIDETAELSEFLTRQMAWEFE